MRQPDEGINVIGPKVALRYNAAAEKRERPIVHPPPFRPAWELVIGGAGGLKNVIESANPLVRHDFGAFNATAGLQRHFYRYGKIAGGTDVTYDGATGVTTDIVGGADVQSRPAAGQRWATGLYGGYEHVIGRFSAIVQVGYTVARGFDDPGSTRLYQRFGWRYQFDDHFWGTLAIRSIKGRRANFIEFGAGYRKRLPDRIGRGLQTE